MKSLFIFMSLLFATRAHAFTLLDSDIRASVQALDPGLSTVTQFDQWDYNFADANVKEIDFSQRYVTYGPNGDSGDYGMRRICPKGRLPGQAPVACKKGMVIGNLWGEAFDGSGFDGQSGNGWAGQFAFETAEDPTPYARAGYAFISSTYYNQTNPERGFVLTPNKSWNATDVIDGKCEFHEKMRYAVCFNQGKIEFRDKNTGNTYEVTMRLKRQTSSVVSREDEVSGVGIERKALSVKK